MKCTKCGAIFDIGMFCPECGEKYTPSEESSTGSTVNSSNNTSRDFSVSEDLNGSGPVASDNPYAQQHSSPSANSKGEGLNLGEKIISFLVGAVILLVVGTIVYSKFIRSDDNNFSLKLFSLGLVESNDSQVADMYQAIADINNMEQNSMDQAGEELIGSMKRVTPDSAHPDISLGEVLDAYLKNLNWSSGKDGSVIKAWCTGKESVDGSSKNIKMEASVDMNDYNENASSENAMKMTLYYDDKEQDNTEFSRFLHRAYDYYCSASDEDESDEDVDEDEDMFDDQYGEDGESE